MLEVCEGGSGRPVMGLGGLEWRSGRSVSGLGEIFEGSSGKGVYIGDEGDEGVGASGRVSCEHYVGGGTMNKALQGSEKQRVLNEIYCEIRKLVKYKLTDVG